MVFHIKNPPYFHNNLSTSRIMVRVALATLPGIIAQLYFFGYGHLIQIMLAILTACSVEATILRIRRQQVLLNLSDNSALLTAILLGISLPPFSPWWLIVIGTIFAIAIAKQIYGGLGKNPFNPAMIGYVVLLVSFPIQMTNWPLPKDLQLLTPSLTDTIKMIFVHNTLASYASQQLQIGFDGISQATPLDTFKTNLHAKYSMDKMLIQPIYSNVIVSISWQWINIGYLLGGIFLLLTNTIVWHIPVSFLTSLLVCATLDWLFSTNSLVIFPLVHLFSGATMLCAFFIATDPITASTTNNGRLIFGTIIGLLVWLIRRFGSYPDGVAFAVLLANICVPIIDYYTKPRVYGYRNKE